jgi:hypothetical protein
LEHCFDDPCLFFFAGVLIKEEFPKGCVNEAVMTTTIKKGGCSFLE